MDVFIGNIMMFGFNFAPQGWVLCQGQLFPISEYSALFALLGTTYGGDGQNTFAVPDFRGRVPIGMGQGPGLSNISLGQVAGSENTTLTVANMPLHTHPATANVPVTTASTTSEEPAGNIIASQVNNFFAAANTGNGSLGGVTATLALTGNNLPFNIQQPYLGTNFSIALEGIFPSRN